MISVTRIFLSIFTVGLFLAGCSSGYEEKKKAAINNLHANFASSSVIIHLSPQPDLNARDGLPNSCAVLIIQSGKKQTLRELMENPVMVKQLFNDAGSMNDILKVDRYFAMPGQKATLHIDRSENARYVGIIAGYYPFPSEQHTLIFDIPVNVVEHGLFSKTLSASLGILETSIILKKEQITGTITGKEGI
ncbi:type VI secretion system lipoprotein TssJ [Escherichia coli]|nr:type VI secretion system lipoprotein TssJ [Escherichia coli]EFO2173075.1 type VI secretion system lipoprotein TssJ [Escherichia coli]EGO3792045.1 type VI secretion system lipoprotein TssJ [Escherichia coli]HAI9815767.1 type VI secretion protein [Escherichia coli]